MGLDPIIPTQIDRSGLELAFHDPKTFFDLPPSLVDLDDLCRFVLQVGTNSIETIIQLFRFDYRFIDRKQVSFGHFSFGRTGSRLDESFVVIGSCFFELARSGVDGFLGSLYLRTANGSLVVAVFQGEGDDEFLLQALFFDPSLLVEGALAK